MATTMVHVRVDQKTKQRAAKTLAAMGISVSDAVRMMLVRVVAEKALPFEVKIPNATTVKAMRAADRGKGRRLDSTDALFEHLGIRDHGMKRRIAVGEFKAKCLHLLEEVHDNSKEIVITKRGRAVARLLPADEDNPPIFGRMRGSAEISGDIVAPVGEKWSVDE